MIAIITNALIALGAYVIGMVSITLYHRKDLIRYASNEVETLKIRVELYAFCTVFLTTIIFILLFLV